MQFVYVCRNGDNEELRYSIRSVLKFFPDADIWVVGGKPSWYSGNYIQVIQSNLKYNSVMSNIEAILNSKQINDSFVYMNDDFFITNNFDLNTVYFRGKLGSRIELESEVDNVYHRKLANVHNRLLRAGVKDSYDYELHSPILIEKTKLAKACRINHLWRSVYGNLFLNPVQEIEDSKYYLRYSKSIDIKSFVDSRSPFLSSDDQSFDFLKDEFLADAFPEPTTLEN